MQRTALVLYGSETGNAQDVAEEVGRMTERLLFDAVVLDMDSVQLRELVRADVVIFALSTTGQGEMPQNARSFWRALLSAALKQNVLRKVNFSSFGLGDSSYAQYNVGHRMLCARLVQLGAHAFSDLGEGNEQHPEGYSAGFRDWIVTLRRRLLEVFPLPNALEPLSDDLFVEPRWRLELAPVSNGFTHHNEVSDERANELHDHTELVPSSEPLPIKDSELATITANNRMTAPDHFQDVRLLDMHIDRHWDYGPGAIAVIYPKNFPEDVQTFLDLMSWSSIADQPLNLTLTSPNSTTTRLPLSPLRHLDLTKTTLTLRWLLSNMLDILSIPRRSFFSELIHIADTTNDDGQYQKERLAELADPALIDELWDYTTRPKRTILEVMMDFTTIKIPWQHALYFLPQMKGRQFSIASGGNLSHYSIDSKEKTRIQLLVAIVDPPSPIIKWRRRYGVCTRYMTTLHPGQQINVGLQQGYLDVRPEEIYFPVVLIGPGTGLAPMRSMLLQRVLWSSQSSPNTTSPTCPTSKTATNITQPISKQKLKHDILIFGSRSPRADFFFASEWDHLCKIEGLTLLTAFSRDANNKVTPKKYVQDRIREEGAIIYDRLVRRGGKVYVSGSSGNMPRGVRQALVDVFVEFGRDEKQQAEEEGFEGGTDADADIDTEAVGKKEKKELAAERYLSEMEKTGRYKQETW